MDGNSNVFTLDSFEDDGLQKEHLVFLDNGVSLVLGFVSLDGDILLFAADETRQKGCH